MSVDCYFRQCAVSVNCRDLAVMAATLANVGRNPLTDVVAPGEPHVEIPVSNGDGRQDDEITRRLARLGPGVAVREMALVGDSGRSADVGAVQDTVVAELPTAALAAYPALETHLHINLARVIADRLRRANEELRLLAR